MLAYFSSEDENHHYMILSGESQTNQALNAQSDDFARKMYVFKIKNHLDSIVDDIHENTSRELELIQVIKKVDVQWDFFVLIMIQKHLFM